MSAQAAVARMLVHPRKEDSEARAKLGPILQAELQRLIAQRMEEDGGADRLQAAALLSGAFRNLSDQELNIEDRAQYAELAAPALRAALLDYARNIVSKKRPTPSGGKSSMLFHLAPDQFIYLDQAVTQLSVVDPLLARIVELKMFGALRDNEVASLLASSEPDVHADWRLGRAWLFSHIANMDADRATPPAPIHSDPQAATNGGAGPVPVRDNDLAQSPEEWQQVKQLCRDAFDVDESQRPDWLKLRCNANIRLKSTVDLLLAADSRMGKFLETPDDPTVDYAPPSQLSHLLECDQIISGRFKILRFIDSGGMGEVYEAWDLELQDKVALKTIRAEVASDAAVIERFKREVRQARGISHPNVCRVYDLFSHGESSYERIWFLTMELLEGETLLDCLRRGPLSPEKALPLVEQMTAGLSAAHKLGIVHRDFKSNNVMLVDDAEAGTRAVITDFGLALEVSSTRLATAEPGGQGTPDYMAPEQRRDSKVDVAADQYALGVVMCEMLIGRRPLPRTSATPDSAATVLPENHNLPPRWEQVIRRCLQVRPESRYADVSYVASALDPRKRRKKMIWIGVAAAVAILGLMVFLARNGKPHIENVTQLTPGTDMAGEPSITPDGKMIAYSSDRAVPGNADIWVQALPAGSPVQLTTDPSLDTDPSIAADGSAVVFRSERKGGGIYLAGVKGGPERLLVPGGRNPQFSPDGRQIAYWIGEPDNTEAPAQLYIMPLEGEAPLRLAADFKVARLPVWSSDGQFILFLGCRTALEATPACNDWWVTNLDGSRLQNTGAMELLRKQQIRPLVGLGGWSGKSVVFSGRQGATNSLWELTLSPRSLRATGGLHRLIESRDVDETSGVAENGTLAFSETAGALHVWRIDDPVKTATISKVTQDAKVDLSPYASNNHRWLVFSRGFGNPHNLWVRDLQSGTESPFLVSADEKFSPVIDDTGNSVAFEVRKRDTSSILLVKRGELAKLLCTGCSKPTGWFDGTRGLLYREGLPSRIKMVNPESATAHTVLQSSNESLGEATWSPATEFLLFSASSEGGGKQVYAVSMPRSTGGPAAKWIPISTDSEWSDKPRWSDDGKVVFFLSTRDGFSCIWGQRFDPVAGAIQGPPFAVAHFHNSRLSPQNVEPNSFQLSVAGDSIYLNLGEINASIWTGVVKRSAWASALDWLKR